jgi:hypothetical protein
MASSYDGGGAVFEAFHGTTHTDIEKIESRPSTGTPTGYLGRGFYASTSRADVSSNYAGEGPGLTARIETRQEELLEIEPTSMNGVEMAREWTEATAEGQAALGSARRWLKKNSSDPDPDKPFEMVAEDEWAKITLWKAKQELKGASGGLIMPVWIRLRKPLDIRPNGTRLEWNEEIDENGDPVGEPTGDGVEFYTALRDTLRGWGMDGDGVNRVLDAVSEKLIDGAYIHDVWKAIQDLDGDLISPDGEMVSSGELLNEVARTAGFDGIVMDAFAAFGPRMERGFKRKGMAGVTEGTLHIVPFNAVHDTFAFRPIATQESQAA